MNILFDIRDNVRRFYASNNTFIRPLLKLGCALLSFFILKLYLGETAGRFFDIKFLLLFSLICAFIPWGGITFFGGALVLLSMAGTSYVMAGVMLMAMLVIGVLYFGCKPGHGGVIALVCIGLMLKIPYAAPLVLGLYMGASAAIPCALGVIAWFLIRFYAENAGELTRVMDASAMLTDFSSIVDGVLRNEYVIIAAAAFVLCVLAVSAIKSLSIDHSWTIAIAVGCIILCVLMVLVGAFFVETSVLWDVFGIVISLGLAFLYEYVFFAVDYSGSERIQFEDDDYFYYVKAIPKIKPEEDMDRRV